LEEDFMQERHRRIVTITVAAALIAQAATARSADRNAPTILLRVTDFADSPIEVRKRASAEARRIYADIDVRLLWTDIGETPPAGACQGATVFVSLLSPFLTAEHTRRGVPGNALGAASPSTGHAYIYLARVGALAQRRSLDVGVLLGRAVAHEVGHLLLAKMSHSRAGLMTEGIVTDRAGVETLFLLPESRAIRARLKSNPAGGEECALRSVER
jgi:hypothetical protein